MSGIAAVRTVLGSQTNDKSVQGQALYKALSTAANADERVEMLAVALVERDSVPKAPSSLPNKGLSQDRWDQLVKTHADMINGHLKMTFFKTSNVKEFAAEALRFVDFVTDEDEKTYALTKVLYSPYVPYQELPGSPVHMTNAEFKHKLDSDPRHVSLIDYIIKLPFDERTEQASMILQVIDDTQDKNLRVALLANAFAKLESKTTKRILDSVKE